MFDVWFKDLLKIWSPFFSAVLLNGIKPLSTDWEEFLLYTDEPWWSKFVELLWEIAFSLTLLKEFFGWFTWL